MRLPGFDPLAAPAAAAACTQFRLKQQCTPVSKARLSSASQPLALLPSPAVAEQLTVHWQRQLHGDTYHANDPLLVWKAHVGGGDGRMMARYGARLRFAMRLSNDKTLDSLSSSRKRTCRRRGRQDDGAVGRQAAVRDAVEHRVQPPRHSIQSRRLRKLMSDSRGRQQQREPLQTPTRVLHSLGCWLGCVGYEFVRLWAGSSACMCLAGAHDWPLPNRVS